VPPGGNQSLPPTSDRAYRDLLSGSILQLLSINREGRMITIASNHGPRTAFDAGGRVSRARTDGRMVSTRTQLTGSRRWSR
jgi:hypothetical protein